MKKNIKKNLSEYYDFKIIPIAYLKNNIIKVLFLTKDCDLIHLFWRELVLNINSESYESYIKTLGGTLKKFNEEFLNNKIITTCLYDHLFLEGDI